MKFQDPSMQGRHKKSMTNEWTDKPKVIYPTNFFKVGGIKSTKNMFLKEKYGKTSLNSF